MSVQGCDRKGCDRKGCKNILCDDYSSKYGYICADCFEELVALKGRINIKEFMNSEKDNESELYWREICSKVFSHE